jgi:hypothetical protein
MNTESSENNKMQAVGTLAVPVLRIINCKLDRKTKEMLTIHGQYDFDHLYAPRKEEGRGLMQTEGAYTTEVKKLIEYVESKEDPLMEVVRTHQHYAN